MVKLATSSDYESINVKLINFPKAFKAKCEEFISQGIAENMADAEEQLKDCEIELELYYHKDYGLFGVESGAVESSCDIYSPYTGEECEREMECPHCGSNNIRTFLDVDCDDLCHSDDNGYMCEDCGYQGYIEDFEI